jgi:hypothetical protein
MGINCIIIQVLLPCEVYWVFNGPTPPNPSLTAHNQTEMRRRSGNLRSDHPGRQEEHEGALPVMKLLNLEASARPLLHDGYLWR